MTVIPLNEILWDIFANPSYCDAQVPEHFWAVTEGLNRLEQIDPFWHGWKLRKAQKGHECTRDCAIKPGERYFIWELGGGWGNEIKMCARCLAMILYFNKVEALPMYRYSGWDSERDIPVG